MAVDTIDLKAAPNKEERLQQEVYEKNNWPALVFVSSPDRANKLASTLLEADRVVGHGARLAHWIEENYGGKWALSEAVHAGIGVHHGRIPRALASRFVKMFNDRQLPILICTSTLIEGVNTAAKSVLIYDRTIDRENYDFFTFSNIRGRAGRLGQHHVGKVFLFHAPPAHEDVEVTPPLFGDLDDAPDELVLHIGEEDATPHISGRIDDMADRTGLNAAELKRFSSLGIDTLIGLRESVAEALVSDSPVDWTGRGTYAQIGAACEVVCRVRRAQLFGVASSSQLTMYISRLRSSGTLKGFFDWHSSSFRGDRARLDNVFRFLRACEYSLPEFFAAVEAFVRVEGGEANYALFLAELPRWFRAEALKNLEEQGVPIQISERFLRSGDTVRTLGSRLRTLATEPDKRLSELEREWILDALPR